MSPIQINGLHEGPEAHAHNSSDRQLHLLAQILTAHPLNNPQTTPATMDNFIVALSRDSHHNIEIPHGSKNPENALELKADNSYNLSLGNIVFQAW